MTRQLCARLYERAICQKFPELYPDLCNTHSDLRTPFLQTNGGQNRFAYRGKEIWNSLDTEFKKTDPWEFQQQT